MGSSVAIGIDIGQRQDPTALCVAERADDHFVVRHLERLELGTPYPAVAQRIAHVYAGVLERVAADIFEARAREVGSFADERSFAELERQARERVWILVDATGVGTPVIDLLRESGGLQAARITGVFLTAGERCALRPHDTEGRVGKAYLVSRLQALIQSRRIALPRTAEARALADELLNYEIRVDEQTALLQAGAFKTGTHDDLATALGLACLLDTTTYRCGSLQYA